MNFVHGGMKTENILVDDRNSARITYFGLTALCGRQNNLTVFSSTDSIRWKHQRSLPQPNQIVRR
ncbi:hypothetical protein OBBRIDRAFT_880064 [Obba rivulosa]|uniref:Protein kinase domain-containing protein n=1 Tax=Obba rivulosa TaxID=1052685 RepID=A0A8E2DLG1_9APHY|nr:hypothetical protein OBBRIDRAFT_880064 [Obba rivulosa]